MNNILTLLKIVWVVCLFFNSNLSFGQSNSTPANSWVKGTIVGRLALLRVSPSLQGSVLVKISPGNQVEITGQTQDWYRIQLETMSGKIWKGWVEKFLVKIDISLSSPQNETTKPVQSAVVGPSPTYSKKSSSKSSSKSKEFSNSSPHSVRVFTSPVFNLYRFGAKQFRMGGSYHYEMNKYFNLGLPLSFSTGEGFSSLQFGPEIWLCLAKTGNVTFYSRQAALFERFFGKGRSFLAGTVDLGIGIRYNIYWNFVVGLEPSIETMVINSESIPWNMRGQVMVEAQVRW